MDFFGAQDRAKRRTLQLVVLFALAVIAIVVCVYVALLATIRFAGGELDTGPALLLIGGGTCIVVAGGSLFRTFQLRAGGPAVAQMLGGRRIPPSTTDLAERTLCNVVEEMAIAAGVPMPQVWVLDEETSLNAFAAGHTTADAVIAVTRGTLEHLSRDELQGVVAHEFSHILNADMRLNLRLMAVLFGITCIATAGYLMMRAAADSSRIRASSSRKGNGTAQIFAIGLVLYVVGSLGRMFATLIRAAVSRQREFLADASAVQFTRNPRGIAGALRKIAARHGGMRHAQASEASHLFFADGVRHSFTEWFASHPPLALRIAAIEPLLSRYPVDTEAVREKVRNTQRNGGEAAAPTVPPSQPTAPGTPLPSIPGMPKLPGNLPLGVPGGLPVDLVALSADAIVDSAGTLDSECLTAAHDWLEQVPAGLRGATNDPFSASALVYAMLLDARAEARHAQMQSLTRNIDANTLAITQDLARQIDSLPASTRLPLLDLSMPALRSMSREQHLRFTANVDALIAADSHLSLFEFTLARALRRHLARAFDLAPAPRAQFNTLIPLRGEVATVLSALTHFGRNQQATAAYAAGAAELPQIGPQLPLMPAEACDATALGPALDRLAKTTPRAKHQLMRAAARIVAHDGYAQVTELELLRAIADSLDVPLPPICRAPSPAA